MIKEELKFGYFPSVPLHQTGWTKQLYVTFDRDNCIVNNVRKTRPCYEIGFQLLKFLHCNLFSHIIHLLLKIFNGPQKCCSLLEFDFYFHTVNYSLPPARMRETVNEQETFQVL